MTAERPRTDIAVLVKAPVAGFAKTRLIDAVGAAGAARLHRRLAVRAVAAARQAGLGQVTLWCAPDSSHRFFRALSARFAVPARPQPAGDLGARMLAAFTQQPPGVPLLVIGTDSPPLAPSHLRAAAEALHAGHDATLLPAEDGGYVLIGLRHAIPALFDDVAWGSGRVMDQTRARARALALKMHEGELLWDVDRPGDLPRLRAFEAAQR